MGPRLKVTAGPSPSSTEPVAVNYDSDPLEINSEFFEGRLSVRIKDYAGEHAGDREALTDAASSYFVEHSGVTWSIQIQGRSLILPPWDKFIAEDIPFEHRPLLEAVHGR
jgi:hypothetical protein